MELIKTKYREPYSPENTPFPPQIMDPSGRTGNSEWDRPSEERRKKESSWENKSPQKGKENPKLLGESETEIDDETTI